MGKTDSQPQLSDQRVYVLCRQWENEFPQDLFLPPQKSERVLLIYFYSFYSCSSSRKAKGGWAKGKYWISSSKEAQGRGLQLCSRGFAHLQCSGFQLEVWHVIKSCTPKSCLPQLAAKKAGGWKLISRLGKKIKTFFMPLQKKILFEYSFKFDLNKFIESI